MADTSSSSNDKKADNTTATAKAPASTIDTSSSSNDKKTESLGDVEEDVDDGPRKSVQVGLRMSTMKAFGFNTAEELAKLRALAGQAHSVDEGHAAGAGGGGAIGKAAAGKKGRGKNKNQNVAYGADGGDDSDFMDQDYDNDLDDHDADDDDDDSGEDDEDDGEDADGEEEEEVMEGEMPIDLGEYMDELMEEEDDMWEDDEEGGDDGEYTGWLNEEEIERQRLEAEEAAAEAAEEERERIRDERIAVIMKKKETLIERYLRIARVMINHRKKNIYLQDYLYHLAFRKGVLRGENQMNNTTQEGDEETILGKANKKRQNRKNILMASRFARFLRKTGHFYDEEQTELIRSKHHHHREAAKSKSHRFGQEMKTKQNYNQNWSRQNVDEASLATTTQTRHHHHSKNRAPETANRKNSSTCPEGQEANCSLKMRAKSRLMKMRMRSRPFNRHDWSASTRSPGSNQVARQKPKTLAEILEAKAQETMRRAFKHADDALDAFEKHRCKMARKKQLIKITKLLERQYSGTVVTDQERNHLVSFVETSVKAQNLAKKKALRRQQRHKSTNKTGVVNFNHQWAKSLERIRELRLKKAKLEQEHRMVLLKKVKHWHVWEKRNITALDAVYEFTSNLASKVNMTRRETEVFSEGIEFFEKQLRSLHDTMLDQVRKMFKAQNMLGMAQRQARDNTSVAAPMMQGLSISDFERMAIENQESHQKLMERQEHLVEQYEKLKVYIKQVADSHLYKQRSWGALRTGRHDMKQLFQLCVSERENLLRKQKEIRRVKKLHRRLFMQIAVVENKHVFKDFRQITAKVKELEDIERDLQTQLHQAQGTLRVMNVKYADTQARQMGVKNERLEQVVHNKMDYSKQTISQRINPTAPNTIYNINIGSTRSQKEILEKQKRFSNSPGAPPRPVQSRRNSGTVNKNKLPRI